MVVLADLGFDYLSIAAIVQSTPNAVSVRLSEKKAAKKSAKAKQVEGDVDGKN